ncbi:MAG: DEAD/DEAH box helicase [bacterium]|nr:DEAD/DEAH box helicase [bacterium]
MAEHVSPGFEKLDKRIQRWIWEKGWAELRGIQEKAIAPLLSAETDVIIASATASGKTEAAYLPIFSYLVNNPQKGIRLLYLSPLKALIDDQYGRLEELCERCDIGHHRWHGDVPAGRKKKLLEKPNGLLLITPESLEALFVNHGHKIKQLFSGLSFIIIDELHAFLDNERGRQLQSLIQRIELAVKKKIPRIGLSATIGDMTIAAEFLRTGEGRRVALIQSAGSERELKLQIRGYKNIAPDLENPEPTSEDLISQHLFKNLRGCDNLIFANSRSNVENYSDRLRRISEAQHLPNEYIPHHGNLSKEIRRDAESRLKDKNMPTNVICTSTLEMGIDIGSVKSIAQIGCPFSVAGLRQRLGRSGRKEGDPSILRVYITEHDGGEDIHPADQLRERLFQAVAMTELLIRKWLEPPDSTILHLSTLIQQLLSLIAQYGGIRAESAWKVLCKGGPFKVVGQAEFAGLLKNLGTHDILSQMNDGTLILGLKGERIVNHYSFYSAFVTYDEYRMVTGGKTLGTMPVTYAVFEGVHIIFAGRRWVVKHVDDGQKVIQLNPSPGGKPPGFSNSGAMVHEKIRREMFKLYQSNTIPLYLDPEAVALFSEGRDNFRRLGLATRSIILFGKNTLLFPWEGDKVMNTLDILLTEKKLKVVHHGFMLEILNMKPDQIVAALEKIAAQDGFDAIELASIVKNKEREKYDRFLPEELLCKEYAARNLDVPGTLKYIARISKGRYYRPSPGCRD